MTSYFSTEICAMANDRTTEYIVEGVLSLFQTFQKKKRILFGNCGKNIRLLEDHLLLVLNVSISE